MGRPSLYTPELATRICEQVSSCVPIHKIAAMSWAPCERSIYKWLGEYPDFEKDYTRARLAQADRMVAETIEIADEPIDKMGAVERARVRVQVRQWAAERMAPKKYGARQHTTLTGADDGPVQVEDASAKLLDLLNRRAAAKPPG
jgi:hypothetical protein